MSLIFWRMVNGVAENACSILQMHLYIIPIYDKVCATSKFKKTIAHPYVKLAKKEGFADIAG